MHNEALFRLAEIIAQFSPAFFFENKLHKKYPEIAENTPSWNPIATRSVAEKFSDTNTFWNLELHGDYPELAKKRVSKMRPEQFFRLPDMAGLQLQDLYPEEAIVKAQYMADHMPGRFFKNNMEKLYPEIGRKAAEHMAINNPNRFATVQLHERYPEFAHHVKAAIEAGRISDITLRTGGKLSDWLSLHAYDPRRHIVEELYGENEPDESDG